MVEGFRVVTRCVRMPGVAGGLGRSRLDALGEGVLSITALRLGGHVDMSFGSLTVTRFYIDIGSFRQMMGSWVLLNHG